MRSCNMACPCGDSSGLGFWSNCQVNCDRDIEVEVGKSGVEACEIVTPEPVGITKMNREQVIPTNDPLAAGYYFLLPGT